jgi:hypothetical protein
MTKASLDRSNPDDGTDVKPLGDPLIGLTAHSSAPSEGDGLCEREGLAGVAGQAREVKQRCGGNTGGEPCVSVGTCERCGGRWACPGWYWPGGQVPMSTLRNWEGDRGMPGLPVLLRLAEELVTRRAVFIFQGRDRLIRTAVRLTRSAPSSALTGARKPCPKKELWLGTCAEAAGKCQPAPGQKRPK